MATSTTAAAVDLNKLIQKTSDYDKDERYMATNDICNQLSRDLPIDDNMQKKICAAILKQLDDKSNDVQSVAVKCLGILVKKVHIDQINDICDKLCSLILEGQDALRDIYSIGLKTLISDVSEEAGQTVATRLVKRLTFGIAHLTADDTIKECLENMNDLLRRFGHFATADHEDIMKAVIAKLDSDKPVIRKRAAVCLSSLTVVLSDPLFNRLMELLLGSMNGKGTARGSSGGGSSSSSSNKTGASTSTTTVIIDKRTLIQTFGTISRSVGHRLGKHLDRLIPLFVQCCGDASDEEQQTEEVNELREYCFLGLESFVLRCRQEVTPYILDVLKVSLDFMRYDPNYTYDEGQNDMDESGDYYDEEDGGDEYAGSDDDDGSWKVRKSALKVVRAVIVSRSELLSVLYDQCADQLIARFKDREETVRLDVLSTFAALVEETRKVLGHSIRENREEGGISSLRSTKTSSRVAVDDDNLLEKILSRVPLIIAASKSHFDGNSVDTKCGLFTVLQSLTFLPESLNGHLELALSWTERSLKDKNQNLKLQSLVFAKDLVSTGSPATLTPFISQIIQLALTACRDSWYKVTSEGLRVLSSALQVARPFTAATDDAMDEAAVTVADFKLDATLPKTIYDAVIIRLEALDIDQEIKEYSIIAAGKLFGHLGDKLAAQLPVLLALLRKRLDNEVTRTATLRAVLDVASSSLKLDLSSFIADSTKTLAMFLRQQNRSLKIHTLQTLDALLLSESTNAVVDMPSLIALILHELPQLLLESDLSLAQGASKLSLTIVDKFSTSSLDAIITELYPNLVSVASSSLIRDSALQNVVNIYKKLSLAAARNARLSYGLLFRDLYISNSQLELPGVAKQSVLNVAKCVAGIAANADAATQSTTVGQFITDLNDAKASSNKRQLTLMCLGEVGRSVTVTNYAEVKDMIIGCFESDVEEVRASAAYALGHLAMGVEDAFLPLVLQAVDSKSAKHQYLLLSSLKEVIHLHVVENKSFDRYLTVVLSGLSKLCHTSDEALRNMVAECLGALTAIHSEVLVPWLQQLLAESSTDKFGSWTVATALRHTLSRQLPASSTAFATLKAALKQFLEATAAEDDLEVRKATLLLINSVVHHNPLLVVDSLQARVVPMLLQTLSFTQEKTVDLGPFKHKIDEGLPLRKAALTAIETTLENLPERMDIAAFLVLVVKLLVDKDEVKLQSHQILIKLVTIAPVVLANSVEPLIEPLEKTVTKKPNKDSAAASAGPEQERAQDLIRSCARAIKAVSSIPDVESNRTWQEFVARVTKAGVTIADHTV